MKLPRTSGQKLQVFFVLFFYIYDKKPICIITVVTRVLKLMIAQAELNNLSCAFKMACRDF